MLPRVVLRFHSTATVVQRRARRPGWLTGAAAAAGVVGGTWLATSLYDSGGPEEETPQSAFSSFRQRLASLWGTTDPQQQQQQHGSQSLAASALASLKATAARWLAKKAEDPESREALLAFGSGNLLDFLVSTATEEVASPEQQHAEQAVVNFLGGYHTASRLLARPGAVPHLLHHIAAGRASPQLTPALQTVLQERAADFSTGPSLDDARQTIQLLQGEPGSTVQGLALQVLTAWAEAGQPQKVKLCSLGVAPALGQLAMEAVALGDSARELQGAVCRLQQLLLLDSTTVTDADLATWMQPLLYLAADAAAAAAAAAGAAASSSTGARADGRGMLGSSAGAADLALADAAMTTLAAAVAAGGPLVKEALKGLPWLPTLDCLALSPDPAIRARAAAALAALATAGQLESQDAQIRWRDMLLGWLAASTAHLLAAPSSSSGSSSDDSSRAAWLWSWFKDEGGAEDGTRAKGAVCETTAANEALARSCVVALRALAQQEGPLGLSVAQLWLSRLLQQLSSRVAAYTSITQLAQTPVQAAAAAAGGLLPRTAKADAPLGAAAFSTAGSDATHSWSADAGAAAGSSSSWWWWGSSSHTTSNQGAGSSQGERASSASVGPQLGARTTLPPIVTLGTTSSSSSWYWPFSMSGAPLEQQQQAADALIAGDAAPESHSSTATGSTHTQDSSSSTGPEALDSEALLESAKAPIWKDAAPVTAASAKAAAEELRAAANAVLTAWLGAAGSLQLPSDLMPGMFAPAVVEAYPMAARVVDMSVAQQRTCTVLELLASVVAEDPSKQAWLLSAGILPVMERLALHADASLEPQTFVTKYSSSNSHGRGRSGSGDDSSGDGDAGSSQGLSLSARIGRSFWGWKGTRGSNSSSAGDAAAEGGRATAAAGNAGSSAGAAAPAESRALQKDALDSCAADQNMLSVCHNSSDSRKAEPVGSTEHRRQGAGQQPSSLLLLGLLDALDFDSSASVSSTDSHPAASAAVASVGNRLVDAFQSKFTAAALASPRGSSAAADAATATPPPAAAAAGKGDAHGNAAAGASRKHQQQHASGSSSAAMLMEFAQGAAGWDQGDLGGPVSRQNGTSSASLAGSTVPQALADSAAVITAAAEEGASWGDGDGLTLLRLQRQVARILSMLALQPAAAQQLTEAAQKLPGGAAELLQGLQQYAQVSKHLHDAPTGAVSAAAAKAAAGPAKTPLGSVSSSSSSGPSPALQDRRKQAAAAAAAAADAHAAAAPTAAWLPWLLESAASDDCLLSSYATKALLHLESAVAYSGSRRRQQQQQQTLLQQQPASSSSSTGSANRSTATWGQRLYQELRSSEELAQFMEGLWPFGSSNGSSSDGSSWRPPVYYPDGVHLMHPADSHNWGMLQPPPVSLIDSLSAAAASAASAAAAAAASDLSQSDIQLPDIAVPTGGPDAPSGASVATAALAVANAAAAAAAAAASVLGADPSQLASNSGDDAGVGEGGGSGAGTAGAAAGDVGVLQPAVSWLAHKLVKFAEIKEEEAQQALQEAAGAAQASPGNPAAPLCTFGALQALLGSSGQVSSRGTQTAAVAPQQQQQGQQGEVVEEILQPPAPEVDIVFVHGIRGGPFVSWRKGHAPVAGAAEGDSAVVAAAMVGGTAGSSSSGSKRKGVALKPTSAAAVHSRHMTQEECWPATWLATDVPNARLLTVEYKAPVTGWEGESLSLPDSGRLLLDKLLAAGVGQRPVVFVCHSMGGLIVKEMLSQSLDEPPCSRKGRLASATCALAFYATPHFGSGMAALGWKLRHLPGASPAPSIHHLSPGPHLAALNARLAELHQAGRVSVLSLCEGLATNLAGLDFMPRILIVPFESAYPGFGEVHVLQDQDHITVCKPASQEAPAYKLLLEFVRASIERAAAAEAAAAAQQAQVSADERAAAAAAEAAAASS